MEQQLSMKENTKSLYERIGQLEIENAKLSDQLKTEAVINQLRSGMLAKASHELRSPLTSIQLSASLIAHYYHRLDRERVLGHVKKINDEVIHFVKVLNEYLLNEQEDKVL